MLTFAKFFSKKSQKLEAMDSITEFKAMLDRERTRSDRNHKSFSVAVFEYWKNDPQKTDTLILEINNRKRTIDSVGHFDRNRFGLFLADTGPKGAKKFIQDLGNRLGFPLPKVSIFVYSTNSNSHGDGGDSSFTQVSLDSLDMDSSVQDLNTIFIEKLPLWKRSFDILGALTALFLLWPLMFTVAMAVKLTSKGPIIFKQKRVGIGGKVFTFYKFRSMVNNASQIKSTLKEQNEKTGPIFKMKNDPRLTTVGRFIRKTSIDELPQFFNVLKGDMSLVGPRPPTVDEVPEYESWQRRRLELKGGLTCLWQTSGRSNIGFQDWMRMDIDYLNRKSFLLDMKLLLKTPMEVITGRGAY